MKDSRPTLQLTEAEVWNAGERQAGTSLSQIRGDHVGRYKFAAEVLRGRVRKGHRFSVLDAACGTGYGSRLLADSIPGAHVVGIDRSPQAIEWGRRFFATRNVSNNLMLMMADCLELPVASETCDAVVSFETLEHLDAECFMDEARRVTRRGGLLIASTPNEDVMPWSDAFTHHLRHYTPTQFDWLVRGAGFEIISRHSNASRTSEQIIDGYSGPFNVVVARAV